MRHSPVRKGLACSFCNKSLRTDRIDVMGFRFHSLCADNVANVMGRVKAFNKWKKAHPQVQTFELTR